MNEMVNRVAIAIHKKAYDDGLTPDWRDVARAAIEAMREPTEAMLEAGPGEPYMDNYVWSKIIDEALK